MFWTAGVLFLLAAIFSILGLFFYSLEGVFTILSVVGFFLSALFLIVGVISDIDPEILRTGKKSRTLRRK